MEQKMNSVDNQANAKEVSGTERNLKDILKEASAENLSKIPAEMAKEMEKATEALKAFNFRQNTLQLGDTFPTDYTLLNYKNQKVELSELLKGKKMIISFYRGSWCPYCNLEMNYYNRLLAKEENSDVNMIAISPELPDVTMAAKDIEALKFTVLSDSNNALARKLKLVFGLTEKIQEIYLKFGIDLDKTQGNTERELPVPATFVIDSEGKVVYVNLDEDYTKRPDPMEVLAAYKAAK